MQSIHGQGYPNLEHIVIDGGSTDGSVEIIEQYSDSLGYWVSEPDGGQTDALVRGFERATGEILCWLNSDDLFEPWTLTEVAGFFAGNPDARFVYGNSAWVDEEGRHIKPKLEHGFSRFVWLNDHNFIPQPSAFWTREIYEQVGGLDRRFDFSMDADLWARFAEHTQPRHVRRPWSRMRFYPEQKNTAMRDLSQKEIQEIRARYVGTAGPVDPARRVAARVWRVILKLGSGGYPPSELARHLGTLTGRGSWEAQEIARATNGKPEDGQ